MSRHTESLVSRVREFFHAEETPYGLAFVRILLCLVLLGLSLHRWSWTRELYSTDGVIVQLSEPYGYGQMLPEFSGTIAVILHTALVFALACSVVGFCTRFSLWTSWVLFTYFNFIDVLSTLTKYSVIASHGLLLLALSNCGLIWSVDAYRKKTALKGNWPGEPSTQWLRVPAWPRRLMQILIGGVYFGAAMTKLQTPAFFSGDQLRYWMNTRVNHEHPLGDYLALYPSLLGIAAYVTIIWEVLFICFAWKGLGRKIMLGMGAAFHIMTTFTLGLKVFPLVCLSIYFCFLNEQDIQWYASLWRRMQRRGFWFTKWKPTLRMFHRSGNEVPASPLQGALSYACLAAIVITGGVVLESQLDLYGRNRPEGKFALKEIEPERAAELLSENEMLVEKDKFFTLDIGTTLLAGSLLDSRREISMDQTAIIQCTLNPPHEDMYIECHLRDQHGQMIDRAHALVGRENLRVTFPMVFADDMVPGNYSVVIRSAGEDVLTRKFVLTPGKDDRTASGSSALAN